MAICSELNINIYDDYHMLQSLIDCWWEKYPIGPFEFPCMYDPTPQIVLSIFYVCVSSRVKQIRSIGWGQLWRVIDDYIAVHRREHGYSNNISLAQTPFQ